MFKLSTGSYQTLEKTFIEDLLTQKKGDPLANLLVLSPSGGLLSHLQRLLAEKTPGFLNVNFLTFYALAERVLAEGGSPPDRMVTEPALLRELINDFLDGRSEVPFASRDSLRRPDIPVPRGMPGALASTLKDLQDSGARVVDCANVAREGHLGDATESAVPMLELNVLMYSALHKKGLRVGADFMRRATEQLPKSSWIKSQKAILLYGFYDLTGVQLDLVLALAGHKNAKIYFPYVADNPAYTYAGKMLFDPALAGKISTELPRQTRGSARGVREEEKDLFKNSGTTSRVPHPASRVDVWTCSGSSDEIWLAAKKIIELADQGVPYPKMSLQARTLDPYLNVIRDVFETHKIPYALHTEESVGAYPLIKTARQVLRGEDVDKSPYYKGAIGKGQRASGNERWSDHCDRAKNLLSSALRLPKSADDVEQRLWEGLLDAIEGLKQLDALEKPVSYARFLEVLEEKLEVLRLPLHPDKIAGVQVMDVMKARGLSFDAVFLIGLNEKLFPRLIREDPFLSDYTRGVLSQALGCRLGRKFDGFDEEKLLFDLATQSARKHLHLSSQRSDEEGKALVTSLYLQDFLHQNNLKATALPRTWAEKLRQASAEALTPKEISVAFHREGRMPDALYRQLEWNQDLLAHLMRSQKEIESFEALGPHDGLIGPDTPRIKALLEAGLSPGTLRDLAQCPFKVYARKVLELYKEEGEAEEGQLTHSGRGKLIHKILQSFYQSNSKITGLETVADKEFIVFAGEYPDLYPLVWEAEKRRILAMLKRFIPLDLADQAASGFKPAYFETSVAGEIQGIRLQGRVDRLDIGPGGFRVVDYKTGSGGIKKGETVETAILKGKSFQLPVYLALAKTLLESEKNPAAREGSALFYRLEEEDATEEPLQVTADFWKEHGDRFYKNLAFLVKGIETGSFYIRPADGRGYCDWCEYDSVCRKEHKPTQIRSENSTLRKQHQEAFTPPKE